MSNDIWARLAGPYIDGHYKTVRGRLRWRVIDSQLRWHLPPPPARLADIGGGGGQQAIPLARDGYVVTILDPSETMLGRAAEALQQESPEVRARVELVTGDGALARQLIGEEFDGVLCHAVLMYLDDPTALLEELVTVVAPGGIVSVVTKNARTMAVRPALEGHWREALAALDQTSEVNGIGVRTNGELLEALSERLDKLGVSQLAWYGVRLFSDGWSGIPPSKEEEELIFATELAASQRDPYRQMSRLFHYVGRRLR